MYQLMCQLMCHGSVATEPAGECTLRNCTPYSIIAIMAAGLSLASCGSETPVPAAPQLRIVEPQPGSQHSAGTKVHVVVEGLDGFRPREVRISPDDDFYNGMGTNKQPFAFDLPIPIDVVGDFQIHARGMDQAWVRVKAPPLHILIQPPPPLTGVTIKNEYFIVSARVPNSKVIVVGQFEDGNDRIVDSQSMPLRFRVQNPDVASVNAVGEIAFVAPGSTSIVVTCGDYSASADLVAVDHR